MALAQLKKMCIYLPSKDDHCSGSLQAQAEVSLSWFADVAASDHITDMLLRAEACWEERLRDPSAPPLVAEEDDKEAVRDVFTAVRKLYGLLLLAKDGCMSVMHVDTGGCLLCFCSLPCYRLIVIHSMSV